VVKVERKKLSRLTDLGNALGNHQRREGSSIRLEKEIETGGPPPLVKNVKERVICLIQARGRGKEEKFNKNRKGERGKLRRSKQGQRQIRVQREKAP